MQAAALVGCSGWRLASSARSRRARRGPGPPGVGVVVPAGSGASVEVLGSLVAHWLDCRESPGELQRRFRGTSPSRLAAVSSPRTGRAVDATTESAPASAATPTARFAQRNPAPELRCSTATKLETQPKPAPRDVTRRIIVHFKHLGPPRHDSHRRPPHMMPQLIIQDRDYNAKQHVKHGAGDGNRTRVASLEGNRSA